MYSSSYYPELTLLNGIQEHSVIEASIDSGNNATITSATGAMPNDSTGTWTFMGWYDSKSERAKKVLDADGRVVEDAFETLTGCGHVAGGRLVLKDDITLYAKWRKKETNVFVRVTDTNLEENATYAIVDGVGSLRRESEKKLLKWNQTLCTSKYILGDGSPVDAFKNDRGDCRWIVYQQGEGEFTLSSKNGNTDYYLYLDTEIQKLNTTTDASKALKLTWNGKALNAVDTGGKCAKFIPHKTDPDPDKEPYTANGCYWGLVDYTETPPLSIYRLATEDVYEVSWDMH